jgi:hypothetical protein
MFNAGRKEIRMRYSLSDPIPEKSGSGWMVRATPKTYSPELVVLFDTEAEASSWLEDMPEAWRDFLH